MCALAPLSPHTKVDGSTEGFYLTEEALCFSLLRCELLLHRSSVYAECTLLTDDGATQRESGANVSA
jgi:hypothetical protein